MYEDSIKEYRRVKIKLMDFMDIEHLADGPGVVEFSKIVEMVIDQKRKEKK